jgi:hypothetical protein
MRVASHMRLEHAVCKSYIQVIRSLSTKKKKNAKIIKGDQKVSAHLMITAQKNHAKIF